MTALERSQAANENTDRDTMVHRSKVSKADWVGSSAGGPAASTARAYGGAIIGAAVLAVILGLLPGGN